MRKNCYRNYRNQCASCSGNFDDENNSIEDSAVGTDCKSDDYRANNCECGFDNDSAGNSMFPSNPMFAQSYVPIQEMNKIFTPEVRIKNGYNFSRASFAVFTMSKY